MSAPEGEERHAATSSRLVLEIWHPDCWTLEVTERTDAGLVAHGVYLIDGTVNACLTAYGNSMEAIDALVAAARESPLTDSVREMHQRYTFGREVSVRGNATRELLVQYDPGNSIHDALVSRGFIPDEPIRIHDGTEVWTVIVNEARHRVRSDLGAVRTEMNAQIEVAQITSLDGGTTNTLPTNALSERQREVYELARERGYYDWPRAVSAGDLAAELGVAKATLLEHLRKAEAKLLG